MSEASEASVFVSYVAMASHKEIVNPLFREVPRRVVRKKSRRGRPGADDESSEDDTHAAGFGECENRPVLNPQILSSRIAPAGSNVQTLEKDKAYLLAKFGKLARLGDSASAPHNILSLAEHETAAHLEELLRDAIPSDPDVPSYPNVHEVEERLAEVERRRAERCVFPPLTLFYIVHYSLCNPAAVHAGRSVASRYGAAAKVGQLREHSARSLP